MEILAPDVAIATYTYRFHRDKIQADRSEVGIDTLFGRATQIFQRDEAGAILIVHEHLSAGVVPDVGGTSQ